MIGKKATDSEIIKQAAELAKLGESERRKMTEVIEKKEATLKDKAAKLLEREAKKAAKLAKEVKAKATGKPVQRRARKKDVPYDSSE
jgi:hypothetical protein